jgi:hypothetical protein
MTSKIDRRNIIEFPRGSKIIVVKFKSLYRMIGSTIVVITGRSKRKRRSYRLASGLFMSESELMHHTSNIVGGQYSLSGNPDSALGFHFAIRGAWPGGDRSWLSRR